MSEAAFHLLRPWWLLALIPAVMLFVRLLRTHVEHSNWSHVIDPRLLPTLLEGNEQQRKQHPLWILLAGWCLSVIALSGPCFSKLEQNALQQSDALVILLDLSPSMLVTDVPPSRLQVAQHKILDLLKLRKEGYTGLIVYSGSAHVVSPLSDDANTLGELVLSLSPRIMPKLGNNAEAAVTEALTLLKNANFSRGRLLLISDGVSQTAAAAINKSLRGTGIELYTIGVGTAEGGPIPLENGGFLQDRSGKILTYRFSDTELQTIAKASGGSYSPLRMDDQDIAPLLSPPEWLAPFSDNKKRETHHTLTYWQDSGYWLLVPVLLAALFAFRRGLVVGLLPFALLFSAFSAPQKTHAFDWKNLWQTPDQQAQAAMNQGDSAKAAALFNDPQWKAYAEYQNKHNAEAAASLANIDTANANYNRGNALARDGKLDEAIKSYDAALKQQPAFDYAIQNRKLVEDLLKQQQNQQNNKDQKDQQQSEQNKSEKNKQDQQSSEDQQKQDQQKQDQQKQQQSNSNASDKNQSEAEKEAQAQKEQQDQEKKAKEDREKQAQQTPEEKAKEQNEKEQAAKAEQSKSKEKPEEKEKPEAKQSAAERAESQAKAEKKQETEQLLRRVPDDPGGLLRNKFRYYYQLERQKEAQEGESHDEPPDEEQNW